MLGRIEHSLRCSAEFAARFWVELGVIAVFLAAWFLLPAMADAGHCRSGVCAKRVAVVQPVGHAVAAMTPSTFIGNQNIFYGVGQPLVERATMAQAVRDAMEEYTFEAQVDATVRGVVSGSAGAAQGYAAPPADSASRFNLQSGAPSACVNCHGQGKQQAGFTTAEEKLRAYQRIRNGTMPPSAPLSPEKQLEAIDQLFN